MVQCVLIRHVLADRRGDFNRISTLMRGPRERSSTRAAGADFLHSLPVPQTWMVGVQLKNLDWLPIFSNLPLRDVFEQHAESRRLEVVWLEHDPSTRQTVFRAAIASRQVVSLETNGSDEHWKQDLVCHDEDLQTTLDGANTANDAAIAICEHFEIDLAMPCVRITDGSFTVIGKSGRTIRSVIGGVQLFSFKADDEGESTDQFNAAQEKSETPPDATDQQQDTADNHDDELTQKVLRQLFGSETPEPVIAIDDENLDSETREQLRFDQVAKARQLISMIPTQSDLQFIATSRLSRFDDYDRISQSLAALGFEEAAHATSNLPQRAFYSLFVHEERGMDAVISNANPLADGLLTEIAAYREMHPDAGQPMAWCVSNQPTPADPDMPLFLFVRHCVADGSVDTLVSALERLIGNEKVVNISVAETQQRFTHVVNSLLKEMRSSAKTLLANPLKRLDGSVPRFERIGIYLNATRQSVSSADLVEGFFDDVMGSKNRRGPDGEGIVRAAAGLAATDHLEFAGALNDPTMYRIGADQAKELFATPLLLQSASFFDSAETFAYAMSLCLWLGDEESAKSICEKLTPRFAFEKLRTEEAPQTPVAEFQLLLANQYRARNINGSKRRYTDVARSRSVHGKALLAVLDAIEANDPEEFERCLIRSVQVVRKQKRRPSYLFDLYRSVAWNESVLCMLAYDRGVRLGTLATEIRDWLWLRDNMV